MKFGRIYELSVEGRDHKTHVIQYPLTCKFSVERQNFSTTNSASFTLYGLSEDHRKNIYYDEVFQARPIQITFKAGYAGAPSIPTIFAGNVRFAYTSREGAELLTKIDALDGGFGINDSEASPRTTNKNWDFKTEMTGLMKELKGVQPGQILFKAGHEPAAGTSSATFNGKVWNILQTYAESVKAALFVDNGKAHMLGPGAALPNLRMTTVSSKTGLLGTPKRKGFTVIADMVFEPNIVIGQLVQLSSTLTSWINGTYTVIGLNHVGTISGVESGDAHTTLTLLTDKATF